MQVSLGSVSPALHRLELLAFVMGSKRLKVVCYEVALSNRCTRQIAYAHHTDSVGI